MATATMSLFLPSVMKMGIESGCSLSRRRLLQHGVMCRMAGVLYQTPLLFFQNGPKQREMCVYVIDTQYHS